MSFATDHGYNLLNPELVITNRFKGRLANMVRGVKAELDLWLSKDDMSVGRRARLQKNAQFSMGRLEARITAYIDLTDDITCERLGGLVPSTACFELMTLANLSNRENDLKYARAIVRSWEREMSA